ncbi:MAG: pre-peptidase C-terminal domain-containing protein [Sumerlaeia bacterium]
MSVLLATNISAEPRVKPSTKTTSPDVTPLCGIETLLEAKRERGKFQPNAKATHFTPQVEVEPNNNIGEATFFALGRGTGKSTAFNITGSLTGSVTAFPFSTNAENNGSIPLATPTGLTPSNLGYVRTSSTIIASPTSGDVDVFSVQASAGHRLTVQTSTDLSQSIEPVIRLWDSAGIAVATASGNLPDGVNSLLEITLPVNGTYYISIESAGTNYSNPFNSNSGTGINGIGSYELYVGLENPLFFITAAEDNGSIPTATVTGITSATPGLFITNSEITNTPSTGDFDHFSVQANAGQILTFEATADPFSSLDTYFVLRNSSGNIVAEDDDGGTGTNSKIEYRVPSNGTYILGVEEFDSRQNDPFNSNSGTGVGGTGNYSLLIRLADATDVDFFEFTVGAGELLTLRANSGPVASISLQNSFGITRMTSFSPVNDFVIFPFTTPIFTGGSVSLTSILETADTYYLSLQTTSRFGGNYDLDVAIAAPGLIAKPNGTKQILFLDFDGISNFDATFLSGDSNVTLSPLSSFLPNWGLFASDENAVIDEIIAVVEDRMVNDLINSGLNGDFDTTATAGDFGLEIRNSRDHADPFGQPNVSRIIIGGTIAESGINTIGIAESIDIGNYATEETAIVLLDILSGTDGSSASVNSYAVGPSYTKIQAVGRAVGLVTAHEAGHFFGCRHTETSNNKAEIMDQGGNAPQLFGLGPDNTWGTSDDTNTRFGIDQFNFNEGVYSGNQNTQALITFGLSTGANGLFNNPANLDYWLIY